MWGFDLASMGPRARERKIEKEIAIDVSATRFSVHSKSI